MRLVVQVQVERAHFRIGEQRGVLAGQPRDIAYQRIVGLQVQVRQALAMRAAAARRRPVRGAAPRASSRAATRTRAPRRGVPEQHERRGHTLQRVGGGAGECVDRRQARLAEAFLAARILQREQVDVPRQRAAPAAKKFAVPPAWKQTSARAGTATGAVRGSRSESVRALMRPPPATAARASRAAISAGLADAGFREARHELDAIGNLERRGFRSRAGSVSAPA